MKFKQLYNLIIEDNNKSDISIFPGSFKPPHKGHWNIIKQLSNITDKVIVLISDPKKQIRDEEGVIITAEISQQIFNLYKKADNINNVDIIIPKFDNDIYNKDNELIYKKGDNIPSPVNAMNEYLQKLNSNYSIIIGNSDKDTNRYNNIISKYTNLKIVVKDFPAIKYNNIDISSTNFRLLLNNRNNNQNYNNELKNYIPDSIFNNSEYLQEFNQIIINI